jgi:hypothetical protein
MSVQFIIHEVNTETFGCQLIANSVFILIAYDRSSTRYILIPIETVSLSSSAYRLFFRFPKLGTSSFYI